MIKFWDCTGGVLVLEPIAVQYEHEEAILWADLHDDLDLMVSVDADGVVILRSFEYPDDLKG